MTRSVAHAARAALCAAALMGSLPVALAQPAAPLDNVVQLSAQAAAEVPQDLLSITLRATREGAEAAAVQAQLRQALDAALSDARRQVVPGRLEVKTGAFNVLPRVQSGPNGNGQIAGWQGQAELIVEGRDTAAVAALAGRLSGLAVVRVQPGLSREAREKAEDELTAQAVGRFRARAAELARLFGQSTYVLREVSVGASDPGVPPVPMYRMQAAGAAVADESLPVQAGKATVTVTVNGSVQLKP
ncbi:SIMPL domain-containing protein [Aquabacterium sp. J223]|uniref:SIMPL domain-containing protein n=1 Tax=Aquabacterium sp. J223 TaxID=2898431 RepID=UPI0021ADF4B5|nr:SIMPL domain-containing protein [Aquabacterium sp. J223]UUX94236.1 SIMPL domain-containing protein [Aquabacterium sp. J223]